MSFDVGRIFITQEPSPNRHGWTPDFSSATKYGSLHFIFEAPDCPYQDTDWALEQAEEALKDFNPERDYILWPQIGDPAACFATLLVLARKHPFIRFLYWNKLRVDGKRIPGKGYYHPVTFRLEQ